METGAVEDEAAYLQARLRVGALDPELLALAAYCGHEAAVLGADARPPGDPVLWAVGLVRWGQEACARALVALAEVALPHFCRQYPNDPRPTQALDAARAWLESRREGSEEAAYKSNTGALRAARKAARAAGRSESPASSLAAAWGAETSAYALQAAHAHQQIAETPEEAEALTREELVEALERSATIWAERRSHEELRAAIRGALVRWALHSDD